MEMRISVTNEGGYNQRLLVPSPYLSRSGVIREELHKYIEVIRGLIAC